MDISAARDTLVQEARELLTAMEAALLEIKDRDKTLSNVLATLSDREQAIINLRHGLDGQTHTLQEVATIFGVTQERIRQIEIKALRKLRYPGHWTKNFKQEYLS